MRRKLQRFGVRVVALCLATISMVTPAFALVREVPVYGVKSINDMGNSDQRVDMDTLKDAYSDFVQTDTLREYFHKDQKDPQKVDLDMALSWLIDNNIISRDVAITVSNVKSNAIPQVSITKFDMDLLRTMDVKRTDMIMYAYKAVFGPINARAIAVETDNVRVDNGSYITLRDLMIKNGYSLNPSSVLPGSGTAIVPGNNGAEGGQGGGAGSPGGQGGAAEGSNHETNYINDFSNWRYQPQGDLWESIFGDTNIFISQNNFNQDIEGGNGGPGGNGGNASVVMGGTAIGGGGGGGGATNTGDNVINYETDYKQIYFIPGADLLVYTTSDVPEVYIQAALSKGILSFDSDSRKDAFTSEFVTWPNANPNTKQSWDGSSPAYVVNRSRNILKTVSSVRQVPTQTVLGKTWNVSWSNGTLQIKRNTPFSNDSGYFKTEYTSKMDAYRYIYNFVYANEKALSDLERDIVNYKYSMELDGITNDEDTGIIKYLIAKGIINYEITDEFMGLSSPISWDEFLTLLYRTANKDARLDFSKIQLTDSEAQWKARGYAPQTKYMTTGDVPNDITIMSATEYRESSFGAPEEVIENGEAQTQTFRSVAQQVSEDGRTFVRFGVAGQAANEWIVQETSFGDLYLRGLTSNFDGAVYNHLSNNGSSASLENVNEVAQLLGITAPSSNLGKYVASMLYNMINVTCTDDMLKATWTQGYDKTNPKLRIARDVCCNIWAITDMQTYKDDYNEVSLLLQKASNPSEALKTKLGNRLESFKGAASWLNTQLLQNVNTESSRIYVKNFQFMVDGKEQNQYNWVAHTGGDINKLVNSIVGMEVYVPNTSGGKDRAIYRTAAITSGVTRSSGSAYDIVSAGNDTHITAASDLIGANWSDAQKKAALREYANGSASFSGLEAVEETTGLLTYVDPETSECFVSWSTLERYMNSTNDTARLLPIKKISDLVLYNEATKTYAYFSNSGDKDKRIALVGTDVVTGSSELGVVYREGSDVYYHIDALRLLMDARQEAAILGGIRSMPLASSVVQNNLTSVKVDTNEGSTSHSLTGISVLISGDDSTTSTALKNAGKEDSVYFSDKESYNGLRWGRYIAVSQSNRAINVISRQFSYTSDTGEKLTAYAIVLFEPCSPAKMGAASVDPSSSLQDLLDAPMKMPDNAAGQELWAKNKERCNVFANWIYGTTGREYIATGYMTPHAYVYASDPNIRGSMGSTGIDRMDQAVSETIEFVQLKSVVGGAVLPWNASRATWTKDKVTNDPEHRTSYLLSEDYRVCIMGNRVYMHVGCYTNVSLYTKYNETIVRTDGVAMGSSAFTVGNTFEVTATKSGSNKINPPHRNPEILITKTETDGTVTCQVGPIYGIPVKLNGEVVLISNFASKKVDTTRTMANYDWTSTSDNKVRSIYQTMFGNYTGFELVGICANPSLTARSSRVYLVHGSQISQMGEDSRLKRAVTKDIASVTSATKLCDVPVTYSGFNKTLAEADVECYFEVKFNAFYYTLDENGCLQYSPNQATDYISPALFTSLNDLIINEMMNADNGAIPIEEVPFGSIVQIGTGYYAVEGTSKDDISFVGYAPLQMTGNLLRNPTLQDVAVTFSGHSIRAGNQQLNISHFFNSIEVLDNVADNKASLDLVGSMKLSQDGNTKKYLLGSATYTDDPTPGDIYVGRASSQAFFFAPVRITFQPGLLMAYKAMVLGDNCDQYTIVSNAVSSVSGPFADLPFFSANALSGGLMDKTVSVFSGAFTPFYGATSVLNEVHSQFQKAFAGDLFTLARMIVFIILIWLVVASWMCYATYFGGLMPILDAIRYPTGNRTGKGIDLMKIISLGSISIETDFKLGRFLQYNGVLAVLICAVWMAGIYL